MEKTDARKLSTDVQQELRYQVIRLRKQTTCTKSKYKSIDTTELIHFFIIYLFRNIFLKLCFFAIEEEAIFRLFLKFS